MSLILSDGVDMPVVTKYNDFARYAEKADTRKEMTEMFPHTPDELATLIDARTTLTEDESEAVALRIRRNTVHVEEWGLADELNSAREKIRNSRSTLYDDFDEASLERIEDLARMAQHLAGKGI